MKKKLNTGVYSFLKEGARGQNAENISHTKSIDITFSLASSPVLRVKLCRWGWKMCFTRKTYIYVPLHLSLCSINYANTKLVVYKTYRINTCNMKRMLEEFINFIGQSHIDEEDMEITAGFNGCRNLHIPYLWNVEKRPENLFLVLRREKFHIYPFLSS